MSGEKVSGNDMSDRDWITVRTELNREGIFKRVSDAVPELRWRRGESEYSGELFVTGWNQLGAHVQFYLTEDQAGAATVSVSLGQARPDEDGSTDWVEHLRAKLLDEVFPALEQAAPGPGETGDEWPQPMPPTGVASTSSGPGRTTQTTSPTPPVPPAVRGIDRPSDGRPDHLPTREAQQYPGGAEAVIDLYRWLPGWGENDVRFRDTGRAVALDVEYDLDRNAAATAVISVVFDQPRHFCSRRWPGPSGLVGDPAIPGEGDGLCLVVDQGRSPLLEQFADQTRLSEGSGLRHYSVRFWEMGLAFDVIAESVRVE